MFDSTGNFYYGESLYHHGVKGMRWGHRKQRYQSPDHQRYAQLSKKKPHELSNEELRFVNERRKLVKDYAGSGKSTANKALMKVGGRLLRDAAVVGAIYLGSKYAKKNGITVGSIAKKAVDASVEAGKAQTKAHLKSVRKSVASSTLAKNYVKGVHNITSGKSLQSARKAAANTNVAKNYVAAVDAGKDVVQRAMNVNPSLRRAAANSNVGKQYVKAVDNIVKSTSSKQRRRKVANSNAAKAYVNIVNRLLKKH